MKIAMPIATLAVACFFGLAAATFAQESPKPEGSRNSATLHEQAEPGKEHAELARQTGLWKVKIAMGDGAKVNTSSGRAKCYMMMAGRFLWIAYNVAGKARAFKGAFMIGFDRRNSRYTLTGIDTHGTYSIFSRGRKDVETGKIKLYGKDDDPHMKAMGFDKEFAHELDFQNADHFTINVYYIDNRTPKRSEMKVMSFAFERDK